MAEIKFEQFAIALRERAQSSLTEYVMGPALDEMKRRASTDGEIFAQPSGDTAAGLSFELIDDGNPRGWRYLVRADSVGARITNQGLLLTPNQNNARQLLTWRSKRTGQWVSKRQVDQRHLKGWVRKAFAEAVRNR